MICIITLLAMVYHFSLYYCINVLCTRTVVDLVFKMADETGIDQELLDYDEMENEAGGDQQNDANQGAEEPKKEVKAKGAYTSIHSSGFRDFLLKPELLRAIQDCGFEHPSEGECSGLL